MLSLDGWGYGRLSLSGAGKQNQERKKEGEAERRGTQSISGSGELPYCVRIDYREIDQSIIRPSHEI